MQRISEIEWGEDNAASDRDLAHYFVQSTAFTRLKGKRKGLVVGRKGAGKSALRRMLETHFAAEANTVVVSLSPSYASIKSVLNDPHLSTNFCREIFFKHNCLRKMLDDCIVAFGEGLGGYRNGEGEAFSRD